uniref:Uncharacterized protein n=1 Tax=Arundo donax TaxID=35708 RepID=A0A0A9B5B3_ARUDO
MFLCSHMTLFKFRLLQLKLIEDFYSQVLHYDIKYIESLVVNDVSALTYITICGQETNITLDCKQFMVLWLNTSLFAT